MPNLAYPKGQLSSLAALTNIRYRSVRKVTRRPFTDTTGATSGGTADLHRRFLDAFPVEEFVGLGVVEVGGDQGKAQLGSLTQGTTLVKAGSWDLSRTWPLIPVTGSAADGTADTEHVWQWRLPTLQGRLSGWLMENGPLRDTKTQTLTIQFDQVGTVTGTATVENLVEGVRFEGGPLEVSFAYRFTGGYTFTPVGTTFQTVLDHDTHDPVEATVAASLDTGEAISHNALLYSFGLTNQFVQAGEIGVMARWRFQAEEVESSSSSGE